MDRKKWQNKDVQYLLRINELSSLQFQMMNGLNFMRVHILNHILTLSQMLGIREHLTLNFLSSLQKSKEKQIYKGKSRKTFPLIYQMGFSSVAVYLFLSSLSLNAVLLIWLSTSLFHCFSQTKFEFPKMKNAKIVGDSATESASTCTVRRCKTVIRDMSECKKEV